MTSHSYTKLDQWISEYFIFRGFVLSAKSVESESKNAKDKSYRVCIIYGYLFYFYKYSIIIYLIYIINVLLNYIVNIKGNLITNIHFIINFDNFNL